MSFIFTSFYKRNQLIPQLFQSIQPSNPITSIQIRTATKRAGGSTKNNRGSAGRRLGVKIFGGQFVKEGEIIIRQRGQRFHPGQDVYLSKDHTLHAKRSGYVKFYKDHSGESIGYRALSLRHQAQRKFVGVVEDRNQSLPRDLKNEGRSRHFGLVDLNSYFKTIQEESLNEFKISKSDLIIRPTS
ncbi:ribosomal L27 protein-domain-containing protein [Melampsora americana]|nr:ribosomal L27 protein-domain-containing protein [Melampsora americana]